MNRKRNILIYFVLLITVAGGFLCPKEVGAQQEPIYSQYMNNMLSVNPAFAGVRGKTSLTALHRKQWINLYGKPEITSLTFNHAMDSSNVGLGFDFLYDDLLPSSTTGFFLNYAYKVKINNTSMLSLGLKGGINYLQSNLTKLDRYHFDDSYILEHGDFNKVLPNFGVGLYWYGKNFYAGLSVPRILRNEYNKNETTIDYTSREERHYMIQGAFVYDLSHDFTFKPGITAIMVAGAPVTADFDFQFGYKDQFWFGMMYRISDAIGAYVHVNVHNDFKIGVGYDYTHTRIKEFSDGTFEILLRYDFKRRKKSHNITPPADVD